MKVTLIVRRGAPPPPPGIIADALTLAHETLKGCDADRDGALIWVVMRTLREVALLGAGHTKDSFRLGEALGALAVARTDAARAGFRLTAAARKDRTPRNPALKFLVDHHPDDWRTMPGREEFLKAWGFLKDRNEERKFRQALSKRLGPSVPPTGQSAGPEAGKSR